MAQTGTQPPAALIHWGQQHAISLDDDRALMSVAGDVRVLALGEPGHGSQEPLALLLRLAKLLAEAGRLDAVAIESGLLDSRRVNAYVRGGPGDAQRVARDSIGWGFGDQRQMAELLRWLRTHNASHRPQVEFYGFDLPGGNAHGELVGAELAAATVVDLLVPAGAFAKPFLASLEKWSAQIQRRTIMSLPEPERTRLQMAIDDLICFLRENHDRLVSTSSEETYGWGVHAAGMLKALFDMFCLWPDVEPGVLTLPDEAIPAMLRASGVRDLAMAENVMWILERVNQTGVVLLFAANGHVISDRHRGGLWVGRTELGLPAGKHLRDRLGRDLCVLLCLSASTLPQHRNGAIGPGTLDQLMAAVGEERALLDFRRSPADPWMETPQSMRLSIGMEQACIPRVGFDVVAYFSKLTPALRADDR